MVENPLLYVIPISMMTVSITIPREKYTRFSDKSKVDCNAVLLRSNSAIVSFTFARSVLHKKTIGLSSGVTIFSSTTGKELSQSVD